MCLSSSTSSGKSTLVNSLLGQDLLPVDVGHTTECFIQIQQLTEKTVNRGGQQVQDGQGYLCVKTPTKETGPFKLSDYLKSPTLLKVLSLC